MFVPEAYITATRQFVAQANNWSLEELTLEVINKKSENLRKSQFYNDELSKVCKIFFLGGGVGDVKRQWGWGKARPSLSRLVPTFTLYLRKCNNNS